MGFYTQVEFPTSDGRMDVIIHTSDFIYIIECKLDGSAEEALQKSLTNTERDEPSGYGYRINVEIFKKGKPRF